MTASLPVLTIELAERLEQLVAPEVPGREPRGDAETIVRRFGQTVASKTTSGAPANKVFCFGDRDLHLLEEILAFYASDDLDPTFYLAPMGFTSRVAAALMSAGFSAQEFEQAILYGLPLESAELPPGVTIEPVTDATRDAFVQAAADGFEWPEEWRDGAMEDLHESFRPGQYCFLARYHGEVAGAASFEIRDGVANLGIGAVVPRWRQRGCHLALVRHRLHVAHSLGCPLALGAARFGSPSFRNQQRAGLRLAYVESGWSR